MMRGSLGNAFRWMAQPKFPGSARGSEDDETEGGADTMMLDLMVNQVQAEVVELERHLETGKSECSLRKDLPDYSWLISKSSIRRRKYLSFDEKLTVETICAPIKRNEWSSLIMNWRSRIREATDRTQIIEALKHAVDDVTGARPKAHSLGNMFFNYVRNGQSLNSIGNETPRTEIIELEAVRLNSLSDRYAELARIV